MFPCSVMVCRNYLHFMAWHGQLMNSRPWNTWAWEYTENALKRQCFRWTEHLWKATANKIFQSVTNFISLALGHPVYKQKVSRQNYTHYMAWLTMLMFCTQWTANQVIAPSPTGVYLNCLPKFYLHQHSLSLNCYSCSWTLCFHFCCCLFTIYKPPSRFAPNMNTPY